MSLASQLSTDLNVFFDTDDFAVSGTYTPSGGSATVIKVILDQPFAAVDPLTGVSIDTHDFEAICRYSDVSAAGPGATVVISETTYYVTNQPQRMSDGKMARLTLSKEAIHG